MSKTPTAVRLRRRNRSGPGSSGRRAPGAGRKHIEVRSAWGTNVSEMAAQVARLKEILDEKGLKVSAVASPIGKVDVSLPVEHELHGSGRSFTCQGAGYQYVRIFSFFRAEGAARKTSARTSWPVWARWRRSPRNPASCSCTKTKRASMAILPQRVLDIMESVNSPALRIAWDNANFVQVGVKPYTEGYAMLRPYLEYFQVKDALATTGEVSPPVRATANSTPPSPPSRPMVTPASPRWNPTWPAPTNSAASPARRPSAPRPAPSPRWPRKTRSNSSNGNFFNRNAASHDQALDNQGAPDAKGGNHRLRRRVDRSL